MSFLKSARGCGGMCLVIALCWGALGVLAVEELGLARVHGNEVGAQGALETVTFAEALFRESDKDGDGVLDYGTLTELSEHGQLVDSMLGSGTKHGYLFAASYSSTSPEERWMAVAAPLLPPGTPADPRYEVGQTGRRYFAVNQDGLIVESWERPFAWNSACALPPAAQPAGGDRGPSSALLLLLFLGGLIGGPLVGRLVGGGGKSGDEGPPED